MTPAPAVLGVDGCPGGWVGALLVDDRCALVTAATVAELVAAVRPAVVGVDIPIGLPDGGPRQADLLARRELPVGRKSSVFPTPVREAVSMGSHPEANAAHRAATGRGLSVQGFHLCRRIAEVDAWVRAGAEVEVLEVHPEVSFTELGADTMLSKRTPEGAATRVAALRRAGVDVPERLRRPGVGTDDALDACAVAWTARRYARGEARRLPEPPERFSDGLGAAIHV